MKNLVILVLLILIGYQYFSKTPLVKPDVHPPQQAPLSQDTVVKNSANSPTANLKPVIKASQDDKEIHQHDEEPAQASADKWQTVKNRLCLEGSPEYGCIIDTTLNIQDEIIDAVSGSAKAVEILQILTSTDFNSVLEQFAATRNLDETYSREQTFNDRIYDIMASVDNIQSNGLVCGDVACAVSFVYKDVADWNTFGKQFLAADEQIGSLFSHDIKISEDGDIEKRLMFLPNNLTTVH